MLGQMSLFQSTHPHGVRRITGARSAVGSAFQSTHPHGVRRHAGAILVICFGFNPRTRTGCDFDGTDKVRLAFGFNPRTRTGCDPQLSGNAAGRSVSIHAPARGATSSCGKLRRCSRFQSTHPHGVRLDAAAEIDKAAKFQSTHPHGVRLVVIGSSIQRQHVSIHAPARGATAIAS